MAALVWTYKEWLARWPSLGSDEWLRHTVVIPWPFGGRDVGDEDGDLAYRAVCIAWRPWWLCRYALDPQYRRLARWERGSRYLDRIEDDAAWDAAYRDYIAQHGPQPLLA